MATGIVEERVQRPSADATRERILAAALDLFSERSFEGASTRLIAEQAGVQQPLLTYHFGNKAELWRTAVGQLFENLARSVAERVDGLRGVEDETVAKLVVADFVRFSAEHPQLHRIIMQECKSEGDRLAWLVEQHIRPLYEGAVAMLEPLVTSGRVRDIPAAHLYYLLTGAAATIFVLAPECRLLTGVDPVDPVEVERHVDAVISMLFVS
ncbi:MAG: TetR/AcrR family transcriptional regulator [Acidimicrobiales bacterium]